MDSQKGTARNLSCSFGSCRQSNISEISGRWMSFWRAKHIQPQTSPNLTFGAFPNGGSTSFCFFSNFLCSCFEQRKSKFCQFWGGMQRSDYGAEESDGKTTMVARPRKFFQDVTMSMTWHTGQTWTRCMISKKLRISASPFPLDSASLSTGRSKTARRLWIISKPVRNFLRVPYASFRAICSPKRLWYVRRCSRTI